MADIIPGADSPGSLPGSGGLVIREAVVSDAEALCGITREALGYDFPVEKFRERLRSALADDNSVVFVAEIGDNIIGYVQASVYEAIYSEILVNILGLAVAGQYRRIGTATELMRAVEDWAKSIGAAGVRLVSGADRTGAHALYERLGYRFRKMQKNFSKLF